MMTYIFALVVVVIALFCIVKLALSADEAEVEAVRDASATQKDSANPNSYGIAGYMMRLEDVMKKLRRLRVVSEDDLRILKGHLQMAEFMGSSYRSYEEYTRGLSQNTRNLVGGRDGVVQIVERLERFHQFILKNKDDLELASKYKIPIDLHFTGGAINTGTFKVLYYK